LPFFAAAYIRWQEGKTRTWNGTTATRVGDQLGTSPGRARESREERLFDGTGGGSCYVWFALWWS